jgi:hypothetical protein
VGYDPDEAKRICQSVRHECTSPSDRSSRNG